MKRLIASLFIVPLTFAAPIAFANDNDHDSDNMKLEELPKAARDTVKREVKDGKITEIDRDDDDHGRMYYEVEFTQNNQRMEIHVAADGKLIKRRPD
jgi:uncharacterized membrane protein YkoI